MMNYYFWFNLSLFELRIRLRFLVMYFNIFFRDFVCVNYIIIELGFKVKKIRIYIYMSDYIYNFYVCVCEVD